MKFQISYLVSIISVLLFCCKSEKNEVLKIQIDSLVVQSNFLNSNNPDCIKIKDRSYLTYFNDLTSYIYATDFNDSIRNFSFKIPDTMTLNQFKVIDSNTVFVLSNSALYKINRIGEVTKLINVPKFIKIERDTFIVNYLDPSTPLVVDEKNNFVIAEMHCFSTNFRNVRYFRKPLDLKINLSTGIIEPLNMKYPAIYHNDLWGEQFHYNCVLNGEYLIYTFNASKNVYLYNLRTKKIFEEKLEYGKYNYFNKPIKSIDNEDLNLTIDHYTKSDIAIRTFVVDSGKYWVRIVSAKNLKGKFGKKQVLLFIYNSDFKLLKEINMGFDYLPYNSFVVNNSIYIRKAPLNSAKGTNYVKISIGN